MGAMLTKLASAAIALAAALSLAACSDDAAPGPASETPVAETPVGATDAPGTEEGFEGEISTESIKVGPMDVIVPTGIRLPEDSVVTQSEELSVMMIDEDPQPVIDAVLSSAEEAGYEVYAELSPGSFVLVGHGNAVLVQAIPNAQMLTWGPEVMKDALAQG